MNKLRLLTILVVGLLVSNIALVSFLCFNHPGRPNQEGPRNILIEKLSFDKQQVIEYDKLIHWHRGEIKNAEDQMMIQKSRLYRTLQNDSGASTKDSLINEIAKVQLHIEQIHYKHFSDIRKLCKPEQMSAYNELTAHLAEYFAGPPHPRR
jgi:hypothetical protein